MGIDRISRLWWLGHGGNRLYWKLPSSPCPAHRYSGLLSSEDVPGINSIILRMYGGYNGKEINRRTSLVHFYPGDPSRFIKRAGSDSIHFYSRVDRPPASRFKLLEIIYFIGRSKWPRATPGIKTGGHSGFLIIFVLFRLERKLSWLLRLSEGIWSILDLGIDISINVSWYNGFIFISWYNMFIIIVEQIWRVDFLVIWFKEI